MTLVGCRSQLVDAVDGVDGLLDALGDLRLDLLGARARSVAVTVTIGDRPSASDRGRARGRSGPNTTSAADIMIGEDRTPDADVGEYHLDLLPTGLHAVALCDRRRGGGDLPTTRTRIPVASWVRFEDAELL